MSVCDVSMSFAESAGQSITTHSSFKWAVANFAWLPSTNGTLSQGCSLYYKANREMYKVLLDHVPYLHANIKSPDMLATLGVRSAVTTSTLLSLLKEWSQQGTFVTSLQHMTQVYEHLSWPMASDPTSAAEICSAFESHALIWLPEKQGSSEAAAAAAASSSQKLPHDIDDRQSSRKQLVPGQFYGTSNKLFVKDHTHVIEDSTASPMRVLLKYYFTDELHTFFLEQLRYTSPGNLHTAGMPRAAQWGGQSAFDPSFQPIVPLYPSTADYCELLGSLGSQPEADNTSLEQAVMVLLHWSGLIFRGVMPHEDLEFLKAALYSRALLPSVDRKWVSASDGLYLMDDKDLAQAFKDKPVHFLWRPDNMQPSATRC